MNVLKSNSEQPYIKKFDSSSNILQYINNKLVTAMLAIIIHCTCMYHYRKHFIVKENKKKGRGKTLS